MDRVELIERYKAALAELPLEPTQMIVGAGGACVMHGVREETSDIDVDVPADLFTKLLETGVFNTHYFGTTLVLEYNDFIDMHAITEDRATVLIDGVCCHSLEETLASKLRLNRAKDQRDIAALKTKVSTEQERQAAAEARVLYSEGRA
ncbi:MAG: hypothetical protein PHN51_12080 [Candidatus Nanopelagicales bacterium]|nr:hypothetical protein [Candidatus Nanopelagicales bacterium]